MPHPDISLIFPYVRDTQPFLYLDLAAVFLPALMDLKEIAETAFFVVSPQREHPADAGAVSMHRAPPVQIQETACIRLFRHLEVWQDHSVCDPQFHIPAVHKF